MLKIYQRRSLGSLRTNYKFHKFIYFDKYEQKKYLNEI